MSVPAIRLIGNITDPQRDGLIAGFYSQQLSPEPVYFRGDINRVEFYPVKSADGSATLYWLPETFDASNLSLGIGDADLPPESGSTTLAYDGDDSSLEDLAFDISAEDLQTAINGNTAIQGIPDTVEVELLTPGNYIVAFQDFGAREKFTGSDENLFPQSVVYVSRLQTGSATVKEVQLIQFIQRPYVYVTSWAALPGVSATVTELREGTESAKAMFSVSISPLPYTGSFSVKDSGPMVYNGSQSDWQTALGTGWTVIKTGDAQFTIERAEAGVYALADEDVDVSGLGVYTGFGGSLSFNASSLYRRFLSEDGQSFQTTLSIRQTDESHKNTLLQIPVTLTRDILSSASVAPSNFNDKYLTESESDARYSKRIETFEESGLFLLAGFDNTSESLQLFVSRDGRQARKIGVNLYSGPTGSFRDPSVISYRGAFYFAYTSDGYGDEPRFAITRSEDLKTFTHHCYVSCAAIEGANRVWAPEFFVDDDGTVHVFVSISADSGAAFSIYHLRALNDELTSWSAPTLVLGSNNIDAMVVKDGSTYTMFLKNETTKYIEVATSDSVDGTYEKILTGDWAGWGANLEAPSITFRNGQYFLTVDRYEENRVSFATSDSLESGWSAMQDLSAVPMPRHICALRIDDLAGTKAILGALADESPSFGRIAPTSVEVYSTSNAITFGSGIPDSDVGTGGIFIGAWIRIDSIPQDDFAITDGTIAATFLVRAGTRRLNFANGTVDYASQSSLTDIPLNTWVHVAVKRVSGVTTYFLNGLPDGRSLDSFNFTGEIVRSMNSTSEVFHRAISRLTILAASPTPWDVWEFVYQRDGVLPESRMGSALFVMDDANYYSTSPVKDRSGNQDADVSAAGVTIYSPKVAP